jgi:predicted ATPase
MPKKVEPETVGTILQGWARAEQGQSEVGITQLRQGLASQEAIGVGLFRSYYLALLAEVYGKAGQAEEGLAVLAEALAVVDKSEERFYEAELYRLYGELSLRIGETETGRNGDKKPLPGSPILRFPVSSPEACFHRAIEIARKKQAKSLELRATTSLSRLWRQQGKQKQARKRLAKIYNWFTEGFDTKDLQEAKMLLEALGRDYDI